MSAGLFGAITTLTTGPLVLEFDYWTLESEIRKQTGYDPMLRSLSHDPIIVDAMPSLRDYHLREPSEQRLESTRRQVIEDLNRNLRGREAIFSGGIFIAGLVMFMTAHFLGTRSHSSGSSDPDSVE